MNNKSIPNILCIDSRVVFDGKLDKDMHMTLEEGFIAMELDQPQ